MLTPPTPRLKAGVELADMLAFSETDLRIERPKRLHSHVVGEAGGLGRSSDTKGFLMDSKIC